MTQNTTVEKKITEFEAKVGIFGGGGIGTKKEMTDWLRAAFTDLLIAQRNEIVGVLEGLRDNPNYVHGQQCKKGTRPCGITQSHKKLADRCETYLHSLDQAISEILK